MASSRYYFVLVEGSKTCGKRLNNVDTPLHLYYMEYQRKTFCYYLDKVYSTHLDESSIEKNTYSPESTIPSSSAASNISRMVVEFAHMTTTET